MAARGRPGVPLATTPHPITGTEPVGRGAVFCGFAATWSRFRRVLRAGKRRDCLDCSRQSRATVDLIA